MELGALHAEAWTMSFVLKMAWRDSRASRRRLVLVSLSVVLGIAALVGIASVGDNLQRTVELQTRALLGADLAVTSREQFSNDAMQYFRGLGGELAEETSLRSMIAFPTRGDQRRLVQLRGLAGGFPFYGELVTAPRDAMAQVQAGRAALLEESIMVQFGVQAGDPVKIGGATFTVAGALEKIPGESAAVAMLSPRVYLSMDSLAATGLLGKQSFSRHKMFLKLPPGGVGAPRLPGRDAEAIAQEIRDKFGAERLGVSTVEERKRDLGDSLKDVYSFLSLVGFVALFLGAVGVASAMHVYVRQKIATVAMLRCLGASARASFAIYLVQGLCIGALGAMLGAAAGIGVQTLLPQVLKDFLPFQVELFVSWPAVLRGAVAGLVICVLFTLLPLLAVRRVSPLIAIRSAAGESTAADPWRKWIYAGIAAAIAGFAMLQAGSWKVGLAFAGAMAVAFAVLAVAARLVVWAARKFGPRRRGPYVWRQGLANLHRPNNRTGLLLLALGLATFLMLTIVLTRATLLAKIAAVGGGDRPNLMFFDVQDDQIGPLEKLAKENGTPVVASAPMVTMRLTQVKGRDVEALLKDDKSGLPGWALRREYRSTYRASPSGTEKVTAGKFTGRVAADAKPVPVSLEEGLARDLKLTLGDELTFDVQGVPLTTEVASLRQVEWQRMQPNFFVVFPEGVLEAAPKTFIAAVRAPTPADSARLQQAVGRAMPSVSAVDLTLILETFDGIFSKAAWVISFMAAFTAVTGVIVLAGSVLAGRFQRVREAVLLRTLGATRRQLRQIQLAEYAVLGVLAAATGGGLAVAANALLARFLFKSPVVFAPGALALAAAAAVAVTLVTGLWANRGVATHPPLEVLRQET
ncbi:MAG TPA: FtsX-like permease family protein [Opitutus sp.]|nr:FtsX-like permease family protein [Opitutus sp.]